MSTASFNSVPLRVVVVDDSALFRLMIRDVLEELPDCKVVDKASNGRIALSVIEKHQPDLVTLDVEMPEMNGIETLRELKRRGCGAHVIMVSRLTSEGAEATTEALMAGAFDFVLKPSGGNSAQTRQVLLEALQTRVDVLRSARETEPRADKSSGRHSHGSLDSDSATSARPAGIFSEPRRSLSEHQLDFGSRAMPLSGESSIDAVIIGTSTGGPEALRKVIPSLPANLPVPVMVVQHMPAGYTTSLATRLDSLSSLTVREVNTGDVFTAGTVWIAPGGRQLRLRRTGATITADVADDPPEHGCRPSVNYLLRSAIDVFSGNVLAVMMTGMGRDGAEGCGQLCNAGGTVLAQHSDGCTVFGMPKAVIDAGYAHRVVKLDHLAAAIHLEVRKARSR